MNFSANCGRGAGAGSDNVSAPSPADATGEGSDGGGRGVGKGSSHVLVATLVLRRLHWVQICVTVVLLVLLDWLRVLFPALLTLMMMISFPSVVDSAPAVLSTALGHESYLPTKSQASYRTASLRPPHRLSPTCCDGCDDGNWKYQREC